MQSAVRAVTRASQSLLRPQLSNTALRLQTVTPLYVCSPQRFFSKKNHYKKSDQKNKLKPKLSQVRVSVCDVAEGDIETGASTEIGRFTSSTNLEEIEEQTWRQSAVASEEEGEVEYFDDSLKEWLPLYELEQQPGSRPGSPLVPANLRTRVRLLVDDDMMEDEMDEGPNMAEMALMDVATRAQRAGFDCLQAEEADLRAFVLTCAEEEHGVAKFIMSDFNGLQHLVNCLRYPFVHRYATFASMGEQDVHDAHNASNE